MVAIAASILIFLLCVAAEALHARRVKRIAYLAFGPTRQASPLGQLLPWTSPIAAGLLAWGLVTLLSYRTQSLSTRRRKG